MTSEAAPTTDCLEPHSDHSTCRTRNSTSRTPAYADQVGLMPWSRSIASNSACVGDDRERRPRTGRPSSTNGDGESAQSPADRASGAPALSIASSTSPMSFCMPQEEESRSLASADRRVGDASASVMSSSMSAMLNLARAALDRAIRDCAQPFGPGASAQIDGMSATGRYQCAGDLLNARDMWRTPRPYGHNCASVPASRCSGEV